MLLALCGALACTWGHEQETPGSPYREARPVVFPGEAYLGATVLIAIDSNYIPVVDNWERHDLHRDRVRVVLDDDSGDGAPAHVRSVFDVNSGRSSTIAEDGRLGDWLTVAMVDLPTQAEADLGTSFPQFRELIVEIDGEQVTEFRGLVKVLGFENPGNLTGIPTVFDGFPVLDPIEETLEPQTVLRLRAVAQTPSNEGFDTAWTIGGLELAIRYEGSCLIAPGDEGFGEHPPRAYSNSEAVAAFAAFGPALSQEQKDDLGLDGNPRAFADPIVQRLMVADPSGIAFASGINPDPTVLGQGPFLDLAFDRTGDPTCTQGLADYVEILNLAVYDPDGDTLLDLATNGGGPDASRYFTIKPVDPERPL